MKKSVLKNSNNFVVKKNLKKLLVKIVCLGESFVIVETIYGNAKNNIILWNHSDFQDPIGGSMIKNVL